MMYTLGKRLAQMGVVRLGVRRRLANRAMMERVLGVTWNAVRSIVLTYRNALISFELITAGVFFIQIVIKRDKQQSAA